MTRLGRAWRTFRALSWTQRALVVQTWLLLPLVALSLRLFGFRRTEAVLLPPTAARGREDPSAAEAVARIVNTAANRSRMHATCLARSLVLCRLLHGRGLAADLRIGVARPGGNFEAHAWVEHRDVVLNDGQDVEHRYAAFDRGVLSEGTHLP